MRMRIPLRGLGGDERGAAAVEFALWSALFFVVVLVALDFGMYRLYQLRLSSAVAEGAMLSFNSRSSLSDSSMTGILNYVQAAPGLPGTAPTVTVSCNAASGGACVSSGRTCKCLSNGNFTSGTMTCGDPCSGSTAGTAGYYLVLNARYTYHPVIVPNRWLSNRAMQERAVVRLQ